MLSCIIEREQDRKRLHFLSSAVNIRKRLKNLQPVKTSFCCFIFIVMIYYLIYLSSATQLYSSSDMTHILNSSRKNNAEKNITGILLYHEGNILQVLEGEEQAVTDLYRKIKRDTRHKNLIQMMQGTCTEHNFADWSMGFKSVTANDWDEYEGYMKLDRMGLLSLIKRKNRKVDATIQSFTDHIHV